MSVVRGGRYSHPLHDGRIEEDRRVCMGVTAGGLCRDVPRPFSRGGDGQKYADKISKLPTNFGKMPTKKIILFSI